MGEVYEAVDDVLGREVAIKTLKDVRGAIAGLLDDRFRQEARAIAKLSHPGIVQVFDIDLASDPPYLVLERVAGPSLAEGLEAARLPVEDLLPLGIQIARALAAAHAAGIVHRDVKPANILSAGVGTWKLADFGVAHVPDSSLTMTGQFFGSPAYAPPEALVKGIVAPAGDVYGLGATLYEAVAGRWPRGDAKGALLAPIPPLRELAPHVPVAVAAAIDRAIAFEAAQRPSADELADLLAHAVGDRASPEPAGPISSPPPRASATPVPWRRWAIGSVIALVIVGVLASHGRSSAPGGGGAIPGELRVRTPTGIDGKAAKDWNKIVDELRRQHYEGARRRLADWERRFGTTPETSDLRDQLDALPADLGDRRKRD
jgi:serine/threonine-protein kinase